MPTKIGPWCRHFPNNNWEPHGCDAQIALIGEAPGSRENEYGKPFVGPSGYDLENWWKLCNPKLTRSNFYIDNCYPYQPPSNKLFLIAKEALSTSITSMLRRLQTFHPVVIVPTGNTALRALFNDSKMNITDWRSSILSWNGHKVIPTIHPAATQRQKILTKLCVADWQRIAEESQFPQIRIPQRKHIVDPSLAQLKEFDHLLSEYFNRDELQLPPRVLSIDVENDRKTKALLCVGFSFRPDLSCTVSTVERDYVDFVSFTNAQSYIRRWLSRGFDCVYQNGMTDIFKLCLHFPDLHQQIIDGYVWDLIEMDHCLDPNDGGDTTKGSEEESDEGLRVGMRDLGTLTSLYTKQPYYKWMGNSFDQEKRWIYNGLDSCVQREIFDSLWWKLYERRLV